MKLLIITAVAAYEKDIKEMLQQAEVTTFSYREVKGFQDNGGGRNRKDDSQENTVHF
jgi:hypothetical protein